MANQWEKEFEDTIYFVGKIETSQGDIDSLELNNYDFSELIMKYVGAENSKIKIKTKKNCIQIERIK